MLLSVMLGVAGIPAIIAGGYILWRMYCKLGIINTILFAGAIPFMVMGIQKAISNALLNLPNGTQGDFELTEIFTTPLLIGLGMLTLALIWTLGRFLIQRMREQDNSSANVKKQNIKNEIR